MSHALFNYTAGRQKRKHHKKKMAKTGSSGTPAPNVAKKMASLETAQVSVKAPKPKGLGLCFTDGRLCEKVLHRLHSRSQAADASRKKPVVLRTCYFE